MSPSRSNCRRPARSSVLLPTSFKLAGDHLRVYIDPFYGWPTDGTCGGTATSTQVISMLKLFMWEKGIPVRLTTDDGPKFTSRAFKESCASWGIFHTIISPHHHEANGPTEAAVNAIKALLGKTTRIGNVNVDTFRTGLLELRSTLRAHRFSPYQLLFGCNLQSKVLSHPSAFQQQWHEQLDALDWAAKTLAAKAKGQHDLRANPLSVLQPGTVVRVQPPRAKRWDTIAELVKRNTSGRSYDLKTESGRMLWLKLRFLHLFFPFAAEL